MTDPDFNALLDDYRGLESRVGVLMQGICTPFCSVCPTPCCRTAICREAEESPFLRAVHGGRQGFDSKLGYLGPRGCKLGNGRPPICHAFICGRILSRQSGDQRRFALEVLGDLVGWLGKKVWLNRHLVEAITAPDLRESNLGLFRKRLTTGAAVLAVLEDYFAGDRELDAAELRQLARIKKPLPA
jgi:hypothetical protein